MMCSGYCFQIKIDMKLTEGLVSGFQFRSFFICLKEKILKHGYRIKI